MYLGYIPVEYDRVYLQRFIRTLPILIIHCAAYHFQGTWTNAGKYNSQGNTFQLNDTKHNSFSFHVTSLKKIIFQSNISVHGVSSDSSKVHNKHTSWLCSEW